MALALLLLAVLAAWQVLFLSRGRGLPPFADAGPLTPHVRYDYHLTLSDLIIEEFFGQVNSQTGAVSIAKMTSPSGWREPGQTPEFAEYTVVLLRKILEERSLTFVRDDTPAGSLSFRAKREILPRVFIHCRRA